MKFPRKFLELHTDNLFALFQRYGEVVRIIPREPLGAVSLDGPPIGADDLVTPVTVRCINRAGTVYFEPFSKADLATAEAWAEKHKDTTRDEFD